MGTERTCVSETYVLWKLIIGHYLLVTYLQMESFFSLRTSMKCLLFMVILLSKTNALQYFNTACQEDPKRDLHFEGRAVLPIISPKFLKMPKMLFLLFCHSLIFILVENLLLLVIFNVFIKTT